MRHIHHRGPSSTGSSVRVETGDLGPDGYIGAGTLLEWVEAVAHDTAERWCDGICVLASVGTFHLDRPIGVHAVVELHADLVYTGRTSMHLLITIRECQPGRTGDVQTAQCPMVFVALDNTGQPTEVPAWVPVTMLDLQRHRQARVRVGMRRRIEAGTAELNGLGRNTSHATLRFRAGRTDIDQHGDIRGGRALRWIDEAAYACGANWTGSDVTVSYVAGIRLTAPVSLGDAVDVTARLVHTSPRSAHCCVHCRDDEKQTLAYGLIVLVVLDEHGSPRPVRQWLPDTETDIALERRALDLIELRRFIEPFGNVASFTEYRRGA